MKQIVVRLSLVVLIGFCWTYKSYAGPADYGFITIFNDHMLSSEDLLLRFSHRFNKENFPSGGTIPTFNLDYNFGSIHTALAYASRSPKEAELSLGWHLLNGDPFSLDLKGGFSTLDHNLIGEVRLIKGFKWVGFGGFFRGMSNAYDTSGDGKVDSHLFSVGVGMGLMIIPGLNLVGEAGFPLIDKDNDYTPSWGGGIQYWIPNSPHVLSLQLSNMGPFTSRGSTLTDKTIKFSYEWATSIPIRTKKDEKLDDLFENVEEE